MGRLNVNISDKLDQEMREFIEKTVWLLQLFTFSNNKSMSSEPRTSETITRIIYWKNKKKN